MQDWAIANMNVWIANCVNELLNAWHAWTKGCMEGCMTELTHLMDGDKTIEGWTNGWWNQFMHAWLHRWPTEWMREYQMARTEKMTDWLTDWLTGQLAGWLANWLTERNKWRMVACANGWFKCIQMKLYEWTTWTTWLIEITDWKKCIEWNHWRMIP